MIVVQNSTIVRVVYLISVRTAQKCKYILSKDCKKVQVLQNCTKKQELTLSVLHRDKSTYSQFGLHASTRLTLLSIRSLQKSKITYSQSGLNESTRFTLTQGSTKKYIQGHILSYDWTKGQWLTLSRCSTKVQLFVLRQWRRTHIYFEEKVEIFFSYLQQKYKYF